MDTREQPEDTPQSDNGEIAPANPQGRALLAGAIVFGLALVAAFWFYALPLMNATASWKARPATFTAVRSLFVAVGGITTMTAFAWIVYARRILQYRQDPPPGAWLWRDTKIVRGEEAKRRAWLSIGAALAMSALCIGFAAYIAVLLDKRAGWILHPGNYDAHGVPLHAPATVPKPARTLPSVGETR